MKKQNGGLIKLILIIIIAIFLISYFHIDVRGWWARITSQVDFRALTEQIIRTFRLIWDFVVNTWHGLTPAK